MPPPIKPLLEAPKGLQGGTPKPLPTAQAGPSPHPLLQGGFEGSVDSVLGFLGFGPQTKANLIGQLIASALPVYHGMPGGAMSPFEKGAGGRLRIPEIPTRTPGQTTTPLMVEGVSGEPGTAPLDYYRPGAKQLLSETGTADASTVLSHYLNEAVDRTAAQHAQNPYGLPDTNPTAALPSRMAEREQQWQSGVHDLKGQAIQTQRQKGAKSLRYRIRKLEQDPEGALESRKAARISTDTPKSDVPESSIKGTPKVSQKVDTTGEALKRSGKMSRDTIVAIREWHMDPAVQRTPLKDRVQYIRDHFDTQGTSDLGLRDILHGNSFVGIGPHPNWSDAPKPGSPKPKK